MKDELKKYIKLNLEKDKSKSYRFKFGSFKNIFSAECFNEGEKEFTYEKKTNSISQYLKDNDK